ncbi:gamma-glutamyltranspeptidase [Coprinopsis marcescibilis]|uniref:Glutathione hydrolase n=1 Tax=Coprinopsis marcescibilis TaxID=230819 RepID=A0A5C3L0Y3_COPMA|nr:gamma-glutamyltranspeptidase [Coprinopsis marcescibilis]
MSKISHADEDLPLPVSAGSSSNDHGSNDGAKRKYWALHIALFFGIALCTSTVFHNATSNLHTARVPSVQLLAHEFPVGVTRNPAYLIKAYNGAVASENRLCSDLGVSVLKQGGNAVDSAVATTFCIGVVNMFSSGIGGGGFMTIRIPPTSPRKSSQVYTIDFREIAPALANETMFRNNPMLSRYGGLSVGVPGELKGLQEAHRRWGSLPWKDLVLPSVELAKGWKVDAELAKRMRWYPALMLNNPDWSSIFAPEGRFLNEGEIIRRSNLSRTLAIIAEEGADALYKGEIAGSILRKINDTGGIMSTSDLEGYKPIVRPALRGTFHGRKVYTPHAPTSGPVLLHMLNLIEHYDMTERNGLNTHRLVETLKFGFSARTRICDPQFTNNTARINEIYTKEYASKVVKNITDDRTHPPEYYKPEHDIIIDHGTSHTSVVDKSGMAVALTSTVNLIFGSQIMDPVTGIILNDEMDDFSTPGSPNSFGLWPSPYNYPQPRKRPLSSITPTIVEHADGSFYLAIGGSGGSRIFGAIYQTLLNLDWGMDASEAIESGRLHNQLYPDSTDADNIYSKDLLDDLRQLGHNITVVDINRVAAVVQLVMQKDGVFYAASDSRKNGIAAGY